MADMEKETENTTIFDMGALRIDLPKSGRPGLSRYYSGKARSFMCLADVHCLEDLKKESSSDVKKRKKKLQQIPPLHCRRVSSATQCASLIVGV